MVWPARRRSHERRNLHSSASSSERQWNYPPDSPEGAALDSTERARAVEADRKHYRAYLLDLYHECLIAAGSVMLEIVSSNAAAGCPNRHTRPTSGHNSSKI
jgi:hypothetical protein